MNNIKPYTKYKPSGIDWLGDIPEHWEVKKLKYLFSITKRISGELGHNVLSITQNGIKVKDIESGAGQLSMDYSKYQFVNKGDFAMNHMDLLTGYVDISSVDGVTSPDYRVFILNNDSTDKNYLLYLLQLGYKLKLFYSLGQGVSQFGRWRLPAENFYHFQFPIPSFFEQTTIAAFLDYKTAKIDRFIHKKKQLIKLLNEQKAGIINNAVTKGLNPNAKMKPSGIEWLSDIPEHWSLKKIKYAINVLTDYTANGSFGDLAKNVTYIDKPDYARIVRLTDLRVNFGNQGVYINEHSYEYLGKSKLFGSEFLMANVGAYSGHSFLVPDILDFRASLGPNMFLVKFYEARISNRFAYYSLNAKYAKNQLLLRAISAAQPKLNKNDIKETITLFPPIEEQQEIVNFIELETAIINKTIANIEKEIALVQEYRTALIAEVVTGKIDVSDYEVPEILPKETYEELEEELSIATEDEAEYDKQEIE